jgi:hypothetical protein
VKLLLFFGRNYLGRRGFGRFEKGVILSSVIIVLALGKGRKPKIFGIVA